MTEQERELLHEFEQLKRISGAQQKAWQSAFENLLNMYEDTKRECARLDDQ